MEKQKEPANRIEKGQWCKCSGVSEWGPKHFFFKQAAVLKLLLCLGEKPGQQRSHLSLIWKVSLHMTALFSRTYVRQVGAQCLRGFCNKAFVALGGCFPFISEENLLDGYRNIFIETQGIET